MQKVLLVDDAQVCLILHKSFLKRQNLLVFTAKSGKEAIDLHQKERVDLMVLDQEMPEIRGHDVCKKIRREAGLHNSVVIIMAITSSSDENIKLCLSAGANDCVTKPINAGELLKMIARYLDIPHRKSLRALSRIEIQIQNESKLSHGHMINISTGGMLIEFAEGIKVNDLITVGLSIHGSSTQVKINGMVVRTVETEKRNSPHFGIKFINLTGQDMLAIHKYVDSQMKMGSR